MLETTVNVGVIRGGTFSNVVLAEAQAEVDLEYGQKMKLIIWNTKSKTFSRLWKVQNSCRRRSTDLQWNGLMVFLKLFRHAQKICSNELGFEAGEIKVGGASDGNFTAALGVPH